MDERQGAPPPVRGVPHPRVQLDAVRLDALIRRLPRGSGPGPLGSRFEHWQVLLGHPGMDDLHGVLELLAGGTCPEEVLNALLVCRLVPLEKGQGRVPPIGIPDTLRRSTARALCVQHEAAAREAVGPHQYAVGRAAGVETVIHATHALSEARPNLVWLSLDAENAYNTVHRASALWAAEAHLPTLAPFANMCLSRRSRYLYWDHRGSHRWIYAQEGVGQGDPLSPLYFSLAVRAPLERVRQRLHDMANPDELHDIHVYAYLDDVLLAVPSRLAAAALTVATEELRTCGLVLNRDKCKAWSPGTARPPGNHALHALWEDHGLRILGAPFGGDIAAPLGTASYVETFLRDRADAALALVRKIGDLPSQALQPFPAAQLSFALLRACGNTLIGHLLRTLPPEATDGLAHRFDAGVLATFREVGGLDPFTPSQEAQVRLPLRHGGCALAAATTIAPAAWLGSWLQCLGDVATATALPHLHHLTTEGRAPRGELLGHGGPRGTGHQLGRCGHTHFATPTTPTHPGTPKPCPTTGPGRDPCLGRQG